MKIKKGGHTSSLKGRIKTIRISHSEVGSKRWFVLWINEDSLSYLTMNELLELRDEINKELQKSNYQI